MNLSPLKDTTEPFCNRAKLDTGTFCNYDCSFCYYKSQLHIKTELDVIKQRIDYLVECGITEVDLSGGESSVHNNWFDILDYCTSKGLYISTISNGHQFAKMDFVQESYDRGLSEVMFSIHGHNSKIHDEVVGRKGAFRKLTDAITNCKALGMRVRLNYVITDLSCKDEGEYIYLFNLLDPFEINFLTLNRFTEATQYLSYDQSTDHIKTIIDGIDVNYINVRYTPYCYMEGYEEYVCNTFQHIYDIYDWNMAVYDQRIDPKEYKKDPLDALYRQAQSDRENMYYKPDECRGCKHFLICDGLENGVEDKVWPWEGDLIKEINHYRKGYYAKV